MVRLEKGIGFNSLAELADVSKPTLMLVERDDGWLPNSRIMLALSTALGVPFRDLWYDEEVQGQ
jgi:DNA-binding XRE family transcriptional regulator